MHSFLLSHHELESLLGGGDRGRRARVRLTERGWLPAPEWIRVDRAQLGLYPRFLLGALVHGPRGAGGQHERTVKQAAEAARALNETSLFRAYFSFVRETMREERGRSWSELADLVVSRHAAEAAACIARVKEAESDLRQVGLFVDAALGRVVDVESGEGSLWIALIESNETELQEWAAAPSALARGAWVCRERVRVWSEARDFLVAIGDAERSALETRAQRRPVVVEEPEYRLLAPVTGSSAAAGVLAAVESGRARLETPPRFVGNPELESSELWEEVNDSALRAFAEEDPNGEAPAEPRRRPLGS